MDKALEQKKAYNKISKTYEFTQTKNFIGKIKTYNYKKVSKALSKGSIIDLGTGNGDFFYTLKNFEKSILAVDISEKLIEIAKKKHNKKIKFIVKIFSVHKSSQLSY